jgi:hypothetical protein
VNSIKIGGMGVLRQAMRGAHPLSILGILLAFVRGIGLYAKTSYNYVQAKDRDDLRTAGALGAEKHANLSHRRWYLWLTAHALFVLSVVWLNTRVVHGWTLGLAAVILALFLWGRQEPVLVPTPQIGKNATEGLLISVTNKLTLTTAMQKAEPPMTARVTMSVHSIPSKAGYITEIELPGLAARKAILGREDDFAAEMGIGETQVHMTPRKTNSSRFGLLILHEDPWDKPPTQNPLVVAPHQVDLWNERVELGLMPTVEPYLRLMQVAGGGGGAAIGSAPRQGKTTTCNNIIVPVLLDPNAKPLFIDGKGVDWKPAQPLAYEGRYITRDNHRDAIDTLKLLVAEIKKRSQTLERYGMTHITEQVCKDGMPTLYLFLDEISIYTEDAPKAVRDEFLALLGTVCRLGPTFGVYVVVCTQRATEKGMPPGVRDLLILRIALYSMTSHASMAILGQGGDSNRADRLDPEQKGVAIVRGDGMIRTHSVDVDDLARVAAYARSLRSMAPDSGPGPEYPTTAVRPQPVQAAIEILAERGTQYIESQQLVTELKNRDDRLEYLDVNLLATRMRALGVVPVQLRKHESPGRLRGYYLTDLTRVPVVHQRSLAVVPDKPEHEDEQTDANERPNQ